MGEREKERGERICMPVKREKRRKEKFICFFLFR
jgi:hypothetical protein